MGGWLGGWVVVTVKLMIALASLEPINYAYYTDILCYVISCSEKKMKCQSGLNLQLQAVRHANFCNNIIVHLNIVTSSASQTFQ